MGRRSTENIAKECETSAFYVPPANISTERVLFPAEEEHHIKNVLRLKAGSLVEVLDGCGGKFGVVLERIDSPGLEGRILSAERIEQGPVLISVALALGRKERMRIAVEKLAELGCHRIVPLWTDYVSFAGAAQKQIEKLRLICRSALKQSRTLFLTRIDEPLTFAQILALADCGRLRLVFCRKNREGKKSESPRPIDPGKEHLLVVGPEGGFSPREESLIQGSSLLCIHLGDADLRFETAAIAGFVLLRQALAGDLSFY
ncbi:MAG TPA: RsmE family RNA methyltransferase [archaeon]|nr:RsmE family RNA methyltransferase [archaeon]